MTAIDVGYQSTNHGTSTGNAGRTTFSNYNAANETGILTSAVVSVSTNHNDCIVGTLYSAGGLNYTGRDSQNCGSVVQYENSFSGLDISVSTGDFVGMYFAAPAISVYMVLTYASNWYIYAGNGFGSTQAYTNFGTNFTASIYGAGATVAAGWANIAKVQGATATDFLKFEGIAVADAAKVNGVAV